MTIATEQRTFISKDITVLRIVFSFLLTATVLLGGYASLWFMFPVSSRIEVHDIHIPDSNFGEPVYVEVARDLKRNFDGGYIVQIRRQPSGIMVCDTGRIDILYRVNGKTGEPNELPDPMTMAFWAAGGDCTEDLKDPLPPSLYSMETCHYVSKPLNILPPKQRCWPVSVFRVHDKAPNSIPEPEDLP